MNKGAMRDAEVAAMLAGAAGDLLIALRAQRASAGADGMRIGAAGDEQANILLCDGLADVRPDDAILSEERKDTAERLSRSRVWIIDPVDGTREYGEGRTDWAVHVALAVDGVPVAGAVALPDLALVLRSDTPHPLPPPGNPLRMVVSRTRPAPQAVAVAEALGAELIPMGSAGAKAMAIIRGEADIYLHSGGQYEWDSCAPAAVALAYGLHVSRLDGSPLVYNRPDVFMPDLLICEKKLAQRVLALLR